MESCQGVTTVRDILRGEDCPLNYAGLRDLGVTIEDDGDVVPHSRCWF